MNAGTDQRSIVGRVSLHGEQPVTSRALDRLAREVDDDNTRALAGEFPGNGRADAAIPAQHEMLGKACDRFRHSALLPAAADQLADDGLGDETDRSEDDADSGDGEQARPGTLRVVEVLDFLEANGRQGDDGHIEGVVERPAKQDDIAGGPQHERRKDGEEPRRKVRATEDAGQRRPSRRGSWGLTRHPAILGAGNPRAAARRRCVRFATMGEIDVVGRVDLGSGVVASIQRCRAPFPDEIGARFSWFLEGVFEVTDKPDLFVTNAAKGLMEDTARNDFAWAEVDGEIVATVWTMTPADEPRLATLGEVYTDPAWRRRGLARAVCAALLDRFDAAGGRVIFLGTEPGSPPARIYRTLGFEPYPRGLMRRERPIDGGFDATWFAPSPVTVRPMTWGDVPRIVALYATPAPWQSVCWMQGLYAAGHVIHDRCNSLVKHTWQATRPGAWLGMFNREGALVGHGSDGATRQREGPGRGRRRPLRPSGVRR